MLGRKLGQLVLGAALLGCLSGCGAGPTSGTSANAGEPAVASAAPAQSQGSTDRTTTRLATVAHVPTPPPSVTHVPTPTPTVAPSPTPSPTAAVPAQYATLYNAITPLVSQFAATVDSDYPTASHRTLVFMNLKDADSGGVLPNLAGATPAQVSAAVKNALNTAANQKRLLGVNGVTIFLNYPTLVRNAANLPNHSSAWTTANFDTYLSYYTQLVAGLRAQGLGVDIETNTELVANLAPTYTMTGITLDILEAGQVENIQNVVNYLKPDRLNIATEPHTISHNTGLTVVDTPTGYAQYVYTLRMGINNAASPATKFGAGSDDWETIQFISQLLASTSLDYYDLHMFEPDALEQAVTDLQTLRNTNLPITITENFINKEEQSVDGTRGPIAPDTLEVRNAYSFWAPVDAQYVNAALRLANGVGAVSISFDYPREFFTYVPYNSTTASYTYSEMDTEINALQAQALANSTVSPCGAVLRAYTEGH